MIGWGLIIVDESMWEGSDVEQQLYQWVDVTGVAVIV